MPITKLSEAGRRAASKITGQKQREIISRSSSAISRPASTITRGTLEVMPEGFQFLNSAAFNYLPCPKTSTSPPSQIRRFDLQSGDDIEGRSRPAKG